MKDTEKSTTNQKTKKEHYIPKGFMRPWANNKKVITYDIENRRILDPKAIKGICYLPNLYEHKAYPINDLEEKLKEIEDEYYEKIRDQLPRIDIAENQGALVFTTDEKKALKSFVISLYIRNPNIWENGGRQINKELYQIIYDFCNKNSQLALSNFTLYADILIYLLSESFYERMSPEQRTEYINELSKVRFDTRIYIITSNKRFCFSDSPVVVTPRGLYCPLSPDYAVFIHPKQTNTNWRPNRITQIHSKYVLELNAAYFKSPCCHYLYGQSKNDITETINFIKTQKEKT